MKKLLLILGLFISLSAASQNTKLTNSYYVNFLDFGGVHDSVTDNLAVFNRVVAYAETVPYKRLQVYIPPGVYLITGTIRTRSDVSIQWYGGGSSGDTVISPLTISQVYGITKIIINSTTADLFCDSSFGSFYTMMDLQNIASSNSTAGAAINSIGTLFHAQNLTIHRFFYGIQQQNTTDPIIDHIGFRDCVQYSYYSQNIWNSDIGDDMVTNCFFRSYSTKTVAHIFKLGSGGMKISSCKWNAGGTYFTDCIRYSATSSTYSTTDLFITNCSMENFLGWGVNISISGGATFGHVTIMGGNISSYRSGSGILLSNSSSTLNHIAITGVIISQNTVGISATSVDDLSISGGTNTSTTPMSLTNCTNVYYDKDVVTSAKDGQAPKELATAFLISTSTPTIGTQVVVDELNRANTTSITGSTPSPTGLGVWTHLYASGFATVQIASNAISQQSSGTSGEYTTSGLSNYDVSIVATTATITGSGNFGIIGSCTNASNFLFVQFNSSGTFDLYQDVAGTFTGIRTAVSFTPTNGDTLHLRTYNGVAYVLKNSTLLASGSYSSGSLTGTNNGVIFFNNTASVLDHFVVTTTVGSTAGWQVVHDATITGTGAAGNPLSVVGSGISSVGAFNATSYTNGANVSGSAINFGPADATNPGMLKPTGSQTVGLSSFNLVNNQNALTNISVTNNNTGTGALGQIGLTGSTYSTAMQQYNSGTSSYGALVANSSSWYSNSTHSVIMVDNASGELDIGVGTIPGVQIKVTAGGLITFAAPTTAMPGVKLTASSAVDPTTVSRGMFWDNGTNLYYGTGSGTKKDLLASSGPTATAYTPTLLTTTNVASTTLTDAYYVQYPTFVHVSIHGTVTATAGSSSTVMSFNLPVTSSAGTAQTMGTGALSGLTNKTTGIVYKASATQGNLTYYSTTTGATDFAIEADYPL